MHLRRRLHAAWAGALLFGLLLRCGTTAGVPGESDGGASASSSGGGSGSVSSGGSSGTSTTGSSGGTGQGAVDASDATPAAEGGGGKVTPVDASSDALLAGDQGSGSVAPPSPAPDRVRTIFPFDAAWLFHFGDATGADATAFADTTWRSVNVPHDWAIEGAAPPASPFSATAATTGRGAFVASGISWYRKHFTLPQSVAGDRVFVEFDGVMANSDVYVNGVHLGHHPYGYVSFRYDMTSSVQFGTADNVVAVKTDTTLQPAERFYAGAGIYRHVRVIAANPVHVDQYATYVTTPAPTATAATVHVTTTIVNSGSASASVLVSGVVTDPTGTALAPVKTPVQTIAAASSASFTFDVPVSNPHLWDLTTPNMYQLVTSVIVGSTTVDDDVTPFGIRALEFDGGLTINGKSVWLQGAANHQDFHGLGMAAPQRAIQRRLAQLKALGVNAIRTAHDPPSPDFLDLTDRMGILVLDEFTDVWTAHKYTDVGDYAAYFNLAATAPTGLPAAPTVPGVTNATATWWQSDFTGWIMRDRNHPSIVLYGMGNEIHDAIATRTPILTKMIAMSHALDPTRDDTQALLDPATSGDVAPGATNALLDVWGDNYDVATCETALENAPTKSGVLTEMTMTTSTWGTILATPGFTGEFVWTGVDYLGEALTSTGDPTGAFPTVGNAGNALMDELGTPNPNGYAWQPVWGVPKTTPPATGTTAAKVVLAADHTTVLTDGNDVSFVKATIADAAGNVVTSATTPVTFAVTGPGTLVAVDSGSMTAETFRGNVRSAYQGVAFAIVQATGAGAITVTAQAANLTAGSATLTAVAGTFVPCATPATCN
jgi:beta-galactosidase